MFMPLATQIVHSPFVPITFEMYRAMRERLTRPEQGVAVLDVVAGLPQEVMTDDFRPQFGSSKRNYINQLVAHFSDGSKIEVSGRKQYGIVFEGEEVPLSEATEYVFSVFYPNEEHPLNFIISPREEDPAQNRSITVSALNDIIGKFHETKSLQEAFKWFLFQSGWADRKNNDKPIFVRIRDA